MWRVWIVGRGGGGVVGEVVVGEEMGLMGEVVGEAKGLMGEVVGEEMGLMGEVKGGRRLVREKGGGEERWRVGGGRCVAGVLRGGVEGLGVVEGEWVVEAWRREGLGLEEGGGMLEMGL